MIGFAFEGFSVWMEFLIFHQFKPYIRDVELFELLEV